ncbi:MAG: hypothetical protein LV480_01675 [Methylacidiphilales bacterium]|nr:hypothetical protein [Candidatus Methylacidiphilales bacterium]
MDPTIKVITKSLAGWFSTDFNGDTVAAEIQEQENLSWQLVSSYGISTSMTVAKGTTDTLVFIYRKK